MIILAHVPAHLRAKIRGQLFMPEPVTEAIQDDYETIVSQLISNPKMKELWEIEHALDGKVMDWWDYFSYCMKMAHIQILQKYYWRTSGE